MKGVGLNVDDSLRFWEEMYSKQHSSCSKCKHSWQKNEKKYIYGIRHLYGLEGSKKNYPPRSCKYLQVGLVFLFFFGFLNLFSFRKNVLVQ